MIHAPFASSFIKRIIESIQSAMLYYYDDEEAIE